MQKLRNIRTVYLYFLNMLKNPRMSVSEFFYLQNVYASDDGLRWLINDAFDMRIISRPELFCNIGVSVELMKPCENQLRLLKECKNDPSTTYAVALCGDWDFIRVKKGASDLRYADRICPTYPSKIAPHEIIISEEGKGKLKQDEYPHGWDEIDWEVYTLMKDPSVPVAEAIKKSKREGSGLDRKTIKNHFGEILKDCKIQMSFFPEGDRGYEQIFFTFNTEYEIGVHEALSQLDRTSVLWKVQNFLVLNLFVDRYCATTRHFKELEEIGLIHDLKVSIPNRHYSPFEEDFT